MRPTQRREQATLRLTWTTRLDLTDWRAPDEVKNLRRLAPGTRVIVYVGASKPWDAEIEERSIHQLVEYALARELELDLQGTLGSIREWWHVLRECAGYPPPRHLRVVPSGATS